MSTRDLPSAVDIDDIDDEDDFDEDPGLLERLNHVLTGGEYRVNLINYFLAGGIVSLSVAALFIHRKLLYIDELLNTNAQESVASQITIYDAFTDITMLALGCFAGFIVYACAVAVYFGQRISSPMSQIIQSLEAYRRGELRHPLELDDKDLLHPIADAVVDLGGHLQQQTNPSQPEMGRQ